MKYDSFCKAHPWIRFHVLLHTAADMHQPTGAKLPIWYKVKRCLLIAIYTATAMYIAKDRVVRTPIQGVVALCCVPLKKSDVTRRSHLLVSLRAAPF